MLKGQFRMTPGQFKELARLGLYQDRKVELLGGIVFEMTPNAPHVAAVRSLYEAVRRLVIPRGYYPIKEDPLSLGRWIPLPDLAVLRGSDRDYLHRLPITADIVLIAEVSDTTYAKDRRLKYRKYASRRIPVYWIVDLNGRVVEVHADPAGVGRTAPYRQETTYGPGERVPLVLDGATVGSIPVDDILP